MNRSACYRFGYDPPHPFSLPTIWDKTASSMGWVPSDPYPRETLHYSAQSIEEIMWTINKEYENRGLTKPTWKRYKSALSDYDTFNPDPDTGATLKRTAVKWFPQYVIDMQTAIDTLIADSKTPDTRKAYLARVFCNNTAPGCDKPWNNDNKLRDNVLVPNGDSLAGLGLDFDVINPLTDAKAGSWPFASDYLKNAACFIPILPDGTKRPNCGITQTDGTSPQSVISASGTDGKVPGIDTRKEMTSSNRPSFDRRNAVSHKTDYDQGYGYLGHLALALHQVRYQPPCVENWPGSVSRRHYVSNTYSSTMPNMVWYFAQPVERFWLEGWGYWLLCGDVEISNNRLMLHSYEDPQTIEGQRGTCNYSVFFPPPTANCHCAWASSAYAIWWANEAPHATWNQMGVWKTGQEDQQMKSFGPHTKLKVKYSFTQSEGTNGVRHRFYVAVKTARMGFTEAPYTTVINVEQTAGGTAEVDLMSYLSANVPSYGAVQGTDAILSLGIWTYGQAAVNWSVDSVMYIGGVLQPYRTLPAGSNTQQLCKVPETTLFVDYIALDEVQIAGDPVTGYL